MSSYYLEQIRDNLGQVELYEKAIVECLFQKLDNKPKESILIDHKVKILLEQCQSKSLDCMVQIKDIDGLKKDEIQILTGQKHYNQLHETSNKQPDIWLNFYDRLKDIKDYYKRYLQTKTSTNEKNDISYLLENIFQPPFKVPDFSGEEGQGKYVDLHVSYLEFINLKKIKESEKYQIGDYLWFLQNFDQFHEIPINLKEKELKKYKRYLKNLYEYLSGFFRKVQPLTDFQVVENQIKNDFEFRWKDNTVRGWRNHRIVQEKTDVNDKMYCKVCQKQFLNLNTYANHFSGSKHKKMEKIMLKNITNSTDIHTTNGHINGDSNNLDNNDPYKKLALLEDQICRLKELLQDQITDSMNQVRKKQTMNLGEMEAENINNQDNSSESSLDEGPIYNPKNLPLGWDGKPIPYWLYKLHGLGVEFKCEICGNYSYWGRRAFERHFSEWRHSYGMKCLRIPNTIHFKDITSINDALALHQKLIIEAETSKFRPDIEEEFEDNEGNVFNKKTYLDLQRQGLL